MNLPNTLQNILTGYYTKGNCKENKAIKCFNSIGNLKINMKRKNLNTWAFALNMYTCDFKSAYI